MERFLSAVSLVVFSAGAALAQDAEVGAELYARHCASCHGVSGEGNGSMAPVLLIQPSDLTTLTERHGGEFPVERVVMRIDGRDPLVSHGSPMPVYGDFFEGDLAVPMKADSGQPILTSQPVAVLLEYLRGLQQ